MNLPLAVGATSRTRHTFLTHIAGMTLSIVCIVISFGTLSCNRVDGPVNVVNLSGSLTGFITTFDENGVALNRNGVTVSLEGTEYTTTTDTAGRWQLNDVTAGIYTINFARDSFSTNKLVAQQFIGNGTAYYGVQSISKKPRHVAFFDSVVTDYAPNDTAVRIYGKASEQTPLGFNRVVLIFLGSSANVSALPANYNYVFTKFMGSGSTTFEDKFTTQQLQNFGFPRGSKVYMTVYSTARNYFRYADLQTGRQFYSGLSDNGSAVKSFTVP
ncbi:MAG: hypothetical protein JNL32_15110 [Candidatus Kapabacteria bacterium]|nr:hypothetical protein [Candidatus Kapabacteria bacterium]